MMVFRMFVYQQKLQSFYTNFLHCIKRFGYRVGKKIDKDLLTVEQNNYTTKIVSACIVYD